jgi:LacI family transcriptional regulator
MTGHPWQDISSDRLQDREVAGMARRTETAAEQAEPRRATIRDVAERSGVSSATVSRVLNHNYPVAKETRERVESAMRELGYVVNAHARALAGVSSRTVGIIVSDVVDPFYAYIAQGVEREAARAGRLCLICATQGDPQRELAFIDLLHEQRAAAVVLVGGAYQDRTYSAELARRATELDAAGARLVLCGRPSLGPRVPTAVIEYDNEGGAFAITDHLLSLGHRDILYLGGPPNLSTTVDRLAGHHRALTTRGIEPSPDLTATGAFSPRFGYERLRTALAAGTAFTAVFAANDGVASGAIVALEEAGLRVPDDVSLVGYDDIPVAESMRPRLTTVHVPLHEMGRQAVRLTMPDDETHDDWRPPSPGTRTIRLGTHVVVRGSTGPARQAAGRKAAGRRGGPG